MKRLSFCLAAILFAALSAFGQQGGAPVSQTEAPPPDAWVSLFYYATTNLQYICKAPQRVKNVSFPVTALSTTPITLTNIVVLSNTATATFGSSSHGFWIGAQFTVAGATVVAALNGTYSVTGVSGSTITFTTSGVSNATYTDSTMSIATTYPLTTTAIWAIEVFTYSGTNVTASYWANQSVGQGLACSNHGNY